METKEIIKKLKEYQDLCDETIKKAREAKIQDAVNWHDLRCVDVKYCINLDGVIIYQFLIEEASPDCSAFSDFIHEKMRDKIDSFFNIEIITEW